MRGNKKSDWVLVAGAARARLFETTGWGSGLTLIEEFAHPASRELNRDVDSDRPGRTHDRMGERRHAMEARSDAKRSEKATFAKALAERLDMAAAQNGFKRLMLIAPPATLGDLRGALSAEAEKRVAGEIDKDLTQATPDAIAKLVQDHMPV